MEKLDRIRLAYIHPSITMTLEERNSFRDDYMQRLLSRKKLHLVLDLDHTLIHTILSETLTPIERKRIEKIDDAYNIFDGKYVVKLRPGLREFLKEVSSMFDVSIYTMGSRFYAEGVIKLLKIETGFPKHSWVIISREDCIINGQKALEVVLSHEKVSVIVDDTEEVWEESCLNNLIKIRRYKFFPVEGEGIEELDNELVRICKILKAVYGVFYDDNNVKDYGTRDVRELLLKAILETK